MNEPNHISGDFGRRAAAALSDESDRACVILIASWANYLLRKRIIREFSRGNSAARSSLFSSNGPFENFAAKINTAFCAGWIDHDVFHDLHLIRRMRNDFAHSIDAHSLSEEPFSSNVDKLMVPRREYRDWNDVAAAATEDGFMIFTGKRLEEAREALSLGKLRFRMASAVLMAVLISNLGIPVDVGDPLGPVTVDLPEHMREAGE